MVGNRCKELSFLTPTGFAYGFFRGTEFTYVDDVDVRIQFTLEEDSHGQISLLDVLIVILSPLM